MSSIAVFLVLGGAAVAATQLPKNSVGTKQLKKNAVTTAKIKKNAINTARLKANAVATGKIKANAVTGAKINAASTPFGRVVAKLRNPGPVAFGSEAPVGIGTYAQPAGETDQFIAGLTVNWDASCTAPRQAVAYLARNPVDPNNLSELDIAGIGIVTDTTGAAPTAKMEILSVPFLEGFGSMQSFEPTATENQTFYAYLLGVKCTSGAGATATNVGVNVVGVK
jgi:hypothetical protein